MIFKKTYAQARLRKLYQSFSSGSEILLNQDIEGLRSGAQFLQG